jgi:hypothetical protein
MNAPTAPRPTVVSPRQIGWLLVMYLACFALMLWAQQSVAPGTLRNVFTLTPIFPGLALIWTIVTSSCGRAS